jgi:Leucine-rich repeat (LRR) protein
MVDTKSPPSSNPAANIDDIYAYWKLNIDLKYYNVSVKHNSGNSNDNWYDRINVYDGPINKTYCLYKRDSKFQRCDNNISVTNLNELKNLKVIDLSNNSLSDIPKEML